MSNVTKPSKVDPYRIGNSILCRHCGFPKPQSEFKPNAVVCNECVPQFRAIQRAAVTEDEVNKTAYQLALERLQQTSTPAIPGGVKKANQILGKTSSEVIAEALKRQLDSLDKGVPVNEKLIKELALGLQKAEIEHDHALKGQGDAFAGMSTDQLTAIMLDRAINEMIESVDMRKRIMTILMNRVPTFYEEMLSLAQVTVLETAQ